MTQPTSPYSSGPSLTPHTVPSLSPHSIPPLSPLLLSSISTYHLDFHSIYTALFSRSKTHNIRRVFAHFGWNPTRDETWDTPWQNLAQMARLEQWTYPIIQNLSDPNRQHVQYDILKWYLNYTFCRLKQQQAEQISSGYQPDKIVFSRDARRVCFNTGLLTPKDEDIYVVFSRYEGPNPSKFADWSLDGYYCEAQICRDFQPLPTLADYIMCANDVYFDPTLQIFVNYEHILGSDENRERLPKELTQNGHERTTIAGSVIILRKRIRRNHHLAIPHWYRDHLQLLLPLYIDANQPPVGALVAEKVESGYRVATILTLEQAYKNARVVSQIEHNWLAL